MRSLECSMTMTFTPCPSKVRSYIISSPNTYHGFFIYPWKNLVLKKIVTEKNVFGNNKHNQEYETS